MRKSKKIIAFLLIFLLLIILSVFIIFYFKFLKNNTQNVVNNNENNLITENEKPKEKQIQIFQGDKRPLAVMIDNEEGAWPHSGLQDAYMIYEIIIEGGESRMMALFKDKTTEKIGPIRSARHYFVHYAMEHDAIYSHFGWSPKAESVIKQYDVNNINGIYDTYYWRKGSGYHNAFSSTENILEFSKQKKYRTISSSKPNYKYSVDQINLENGIDVSSIFLKYSTLHNVSYNYSKENNVFYRSMRGIADKDRETKEQYYAKNIIIMYMENYTLNDGENKGRQELLDIGTGSGYYITNGKYIEITWKKDSISDKTKWLDKSGNEIVLNDGITYVQIIPKENTVKFE